MRSLLRGVVAFVCAVATFYFVFWVPFSLVPRAGAVPWLPPVVSFACAAAVAGYLWRSSASTPTGFVGCVVTGAIAVGAVGFSAGFFGPMLVSPGANQGPLLGIFITGPLGFLIGAFGGGLYWWVRAGAGDAAGERAV